MCAAIFDMNKIGKRKGIEEKCLGRCTVMEKVYSSTQDLCSFWPEDFFPVQDIVGHSANPKIGLWVYLGCGHWGDLPYLWIVKDERSLDPMPNNKNSLRMYLRAWDNVRSGHQERISSSWRNMSREREYPHGNSSCETQYYITTWAWKDTCMLTYKWLKT